MRNFTRFVYSDYIADWVEQTIRDNEATSETEEEGAEETDILSLHPHDSIVY